MKLRAQEKANPRETAHFKRLALIDHLLSNVELALRRSTDVDEQDEAVTLKRLLMERKREVETQPAEAA